MLQKITDLLTEVSSFSVNDPEELEQFRLKYLSKKGILSDLFEDFKHVPGSEKKEIGQKLNDLKQNALEKYNTLKTELLNSEDKSVAADLTRPPFHIPLDRVILFPLSGMRLLIYLPE